MRLIRFPDPFAVVYGDTLRYFAHEEARTHRPARGWQIGRRLALALRRVTRVGGGPAVACGQGRDGSELASRMAGAVPTE